MTNTGTLLTRCGTESFQTKRRHDRAEGISLGRADNPGHGLIWHLFGETRQSGSIVTVLALYPLLGEGLQSSVPRRNESMLKENPGPGLIWYLLGAMRQSGIVVTVLALLHSWARVRSFPYREETNPC